MRDVGKSSGSCTRNERSETFRMNTVVHVFFASAPTSMSIQLRNYQSDRLPPFVERATYAVTAAW